MEPDLASKHDHTGSKKWKVPALGKQALFLDSLEDQRSFLEAQVLGNYNVVCVLSEERHVGRRFRYSSVQEWF
ncbi:hypothetical protein AYI68_g5088 [Smittium mucronatum]|uniref:Uncharacterized protein n=1 Tax=Smittium mucronatum TaxID=133383 RepID=A0A1R0GVA8_9FUNG|nr:hypothetical protein AYI68_g5088 [Smittium mucronatum]